MDSKPEENTSTTIKKPKSAGLSQASYAKSTSSSDSKSKSQNIKFKYVKPVGQSKIAAQLNLKAPKPKKPKTKIPNIKPKYIKPTGESRVSAEPKIKVGDDDDSLAYQTKNHSFRDHARVKLPFDVKRDKMRSTVREILDEMLSSIVVEVSLRLGVTLHAQEESIRDIVEIYLKQNSHVANRTNRIKQDCLTIVNAELHRLKQELKTTLPENIMAEIEEVTFGKLKMEIKKTETLVEKAKQNSQANMDQSAQQEQKLQILKDVADSLPTNLAQLTEQVNIQSRDFIESHVEQELNSLSDKQTAAQNKRLDELTKALRDLQDSAYDSLGKAVHESKNKEAEFDKKMKDIDGKCCVIS